MKKERGQEAGRDEKLVTLEEAVERSGVEYNQMHWEILKEENTKLKGKTFIYRAYSYDVTIEHEF